ncbi:MAG: histidine kinase dimerization/phospho-acceptor domain-containing protein [Alistipes senegalensis]
MEATRKELEREKELTNMKINFFTNISHELRTPLTLIYGPVNMLPGIQDKNRQRELINLINDSIQRLLKLVDQTLNLSRIENDTLPLSVCRQDILPRGRAHDRRLRLLRPREADRHQPDSHAAGQDDRRRQFDKSARFFRT